MKAPYRNAIRSKQLIREAMISLMDKNKSVSDITVSDIVKAANINRGTFYNHYGNPNDVVEEIKDELMQSLDLALRTSSKNGDIDGFLASMLDHFKRNEAEYRKMVNAIPISVLDNVKKEAIKQIRFIVSIDETTLYFIVNGIVGLFLDYLKNNVSFDYDDIYGRAKTFVHLAIDTYNLKNAK